MHDSAKNNIHVDLSASHLTQVLREEIGDLKPRMLLVQALMNMIPVRVGCRLRASILRRAGFAIDHGALFLGTPRLLGTGDIYSRLKIGRYSTFNVGCTFDLEGKITIGNSVGFGHDVQVITSTHELGAEDRRTGKMLTYDVTVDDGCWIGTRATILPGVTIGRGSVISAGTVVNRDVPPNTVVSGTQRIPIDKWLLLTKQTDQASTANGAKT